MVSRPPAFDAATNKIDGCNLSSPWRAVLVMCHGPKGQPSIICVKIQRMAVLQGCLCFVLHMFVCVQHTALGSDSSSRGTELQCNVPTPPVSFNWVCYVLNAHLSNRLGKVVLETQYFSVCLYKRKREWRRCVGSGEK